MNKYSDGKYHLSRIVRGTLMRNINLGFFEKIYIYLRCRKDWKNERFCNLYTGLSLSRSELATKGTNIHYSDVHDIESEESKILVVSPFVTAELGQLIAKRDNILAKKICVVNYNRNNNVRHKILRFPDAIAFLDDQIRIIEGDIACLEAEYQATISSFQEKYDYNIVHGDVRLATASIKGAQVRRDRYRAAKKIKYDALIMLISEKIRIISVINARINVFKTWRFSRTRYYYSLACTLNKGLPVLVYSDTDFDVIAKQKFEQEYTGEFESSKRKFDQLKQEIEFPDEDTIIEKSPEEIIALKALATAKKDNGTHRSETSIEINAGVKFENTSVDENDVLEEMKVSVPDSSEVIENINHDGTHVFTVDNLAVETEVTEMQNSEGTEDKDTKKPSIVAKDYEIDKKAVGDSIRTENTDDMNSDKSFTTVEDDRIQKTYISDSISIESVQKINSDEFSDTVKDDETIDTTVSASASTVYEWDRNSNEPSVISANDNIGDIIVDDSESGDRVEDIDTYGLFVTNIDGMAGKTNVSHSASSEHVEDVDSELPFVTENTEVNEDDTRGLKFLENLDSGELSTPLAENVSDEEHTRDFTITKTAENMYFDKTSMGDVNIETNEGEAEITENTESKPLEAHSSNDAYNVEEELKNKVFAKAGIVSDFVAEEMTISDFTSTELVESMSFDEIFDTIADIAEGEIEEQEVDGIKIETLDPTEVSCVEAQKEFGSGDSYTTVANNAEDVEPSEVEYAITQGEVDSVEPHSAVADDVSEEMNVRDSVATEIDKDKSINEIFNDIADNAEEVGTSEVEYARTQGEMDFVEPSITVADDLVEKVNVRDSADAETDSYKNIDEIFNDIADNAEGVGFFEVEYAKAQGEMDSVEPSVVVAGDVAAEVNVRDSAATEIDKDKSIDEIFIDIAEEVGASEVEYAKAQGETDSVETSSAVADDVAEELNVSDTVATETDNDKSIDEIFNNIADNEEKVDSSETAAAEIFEETNFKESSTAVADDVAKEVNVSDSATIKTFTDTSIDEIVNDISGNVEEVEFSEAADVEILEEADSVESPTSVADGAIEKLNVSDSTTTEDDTDKSIKAIFNDNAKKVEFSEVADIEMSEETDFVEHSTSGANEVTEKVNESDFAVIETDTDKSIDEILNTIADNAEEVASSETEIETGTEAADAEMLEETDSVESSAIVTNVIREEAGVIEDGSSGIEDDMDFDEVFNAIVGVADIDTK